MILPDRLPLDADLVGRCRTTAEVSRCPLNGDVRTADTRLITELVVSRRTDGPAQRVTYGRSRRLPLDASLAGDQLAAGLRAVGELIEFRAAISASLVVL